MRESFPGCSVVKNSPANRCKRLGFNPWVRKIPWNKKWQPISVLLTGEFHGQRSQVGYSPWGHQKSDMTEHTHTRERTQEHEMSGCGIKYHFGGSTQLQISQNTVFLIIVLFYESKIPLSVVTLLGLGSPLSKRSSHLRGTEKLDCSSCISLPWQVAQMVNWVIPLPWSSMILACR